MLLIKCRIRLKINVYFMLAVHLIRIGIRVEENLVTHHAFVTNIQILTIAVNLSSTD